MRKVRRINAVLTNGPERAATFYLRRDFWMGSLAPEPNPYVGTVEVPTLNLDALLREEAIDLVVCDVEGAEATLFEGADLAGVDRVFIETHDHVTGLSGVRRLFATMAGHGFVYDPRHSLGSVVLFRGSARTTSCGPTPARDAQGSGCQVAGRVSKPSPTSDVQPSSSR